MDTFTGLLHHSDPQFIMNRRKMLDASANLSTTQLKRQVDYLRSNPEPPADESGVSQRMLQELRGGVYTPDYLKAILDSTGGGTSGGSVMIRQDLEVPLYQLFIKTFPFFEKIKHKPANGLVHVAEQMTAPSSGSLGDSLRATEITATTYDSAVYNRVSFPIGVFSQGRGVSFKELAAVRQGGSAFNPGQLEMAAGMLKMATDIQFYMFQGNATTSAGAGLTTELGAYNSAGFDGLRSVLGSVGAYTADNATQFDVGTLNLLESMQTGTTRAANNGGMPDIGVLSMNAKQQFDSEQQGNQRYLGDLSETIPGVKVNRYAWANGTIDLLPVPGTTMGTYTRASDSATVEDIYILDSNTLAVVWLYADNFTVLEIPSGVDGILSQRWIIFGMFGLEIAAPPFCAKVRRISS